MRNEDYLEQEDYYKEQAYLSSEKDAEFEEWLYWKEDMKADQKRKEAKITVKREDLIIIDHDKTTIDF